MTRRLRTMTLMAGLVWLVAVDALAIIPPGGNNVPNCAPCEYWDGYNCVARSINAYAVAEEVDGQTVYKVVVETTPPGGAVSLSTVPPPDGSPVGGTVDSGGVLSPDGSASTMTVRASLIGSDGSVCASIDVDVPVDGGGGDCESCESCSPGDETASIVSENLRYNIKTGGANFEKAPALRMRMKSLTPAAGQPTLQNLSILRKTGTEVITSATTKVIRQVLTSQALVDIVTTSSSSYEIRYYKAADKGTKNAAGEYVPTGNFYLKHAVQYLAGSAPVLRITKSMGGTDHVLEYEQSGTTLTLRRGGMGSPVTWADQTERASLDLGGGKTNVTITVKNALGQIQSTTMETNQGLPWGQALVGRVEDPDGTCPLRTSYTYYTTLGEAGYGRVKAMTRSDGYWVAHEYESLGRETLRAEAWKDVAFNPASTVAELAATAKSTHLDYASVDTADNLSISPRKPRMVEVKVAGVTVAKTFHSYKFDSGFRVETEERCASATAGFGASANLRTERWYDYIDPDRLRAVIQPDGVQQSITYVAGSYAANGTQPGTFTAGTGDYLCRTTVQGTTASPGGLSGKTTSEIVVLNKWGGVVLSETYVKTDAGSERIGWQVFDLDDYSHELHRYTHNGEQVDTAWNDCCGMESRTDATGAQTLYASYDGMKRPLTVVKTGVAASAPYAAQGDINTTYEYSAAGRILSQSVSGGGISLVSTNGFDQAGRPTRTRDAAGLATDYGYSGDARISTITRPGGATEITENYRDGRIKSLTGSGVVARFYDYGVNTDGTTWMKVYAGPAGSSSPLWETTTFDLLGRTINSTKPKFGSGTEVTASEYYEASDPASGQLKGHLRRTSRTGLADTLYEYDTLGNVTRSGQDIGSTAGALDLASWDRITDMDTSFVKEGSDWWSVTTRKVYATANSAAPTTLSTSRQRLTGFGTGVTQEMRETDIHNNLTTQTKVVDRTARLVTQTTDTPDSSVNVQTISRNGLIQSSRSATDHTTTYAHDGLGRETRATDPRTGDSTHYRETHYNDKGQVDWVEDSADKRTSFGYDPVTGRRVAVTDPASKTTYYSYTTRGEQQRVWGYNTYPVEYFHDDFGRMHTMTTYRYDTGVNWFAATWPDNAGTGDTTTWNYDPATGLLAEKVYADSRKTTYTYEAQGRLATRTWARTVSGAALVTTYNYDQNTGELLTVDYSDTTPDVTYTYTRLGHQQTVADAAGGHTFAYNAALQLDTESIDGSLYTRLITRQYQGTGTGQVPGRSAGFKLGTTANPAADQVVTYGFDSVGRFETVNDGARTFTYTREANSDLIGGYSSGSFSVDYDYESHRDGRTKVQSTYGTTVMGRFDYVTDNAGRRQTREQSGAMFGAVDFNDFDYNDRGEVSHSRRYAGTVGNPGAEDAAQHFQYTFDPIGNRREARRADMAWDYNADSVNQYTGQGSVQLTYDWDGNETGDGTWTRTWDAENRLVAVEKSDQRLEFVYDYQSRRIQKKVYSGSTGNWTLVSDQRFIYDGWNLIAVLSPQSAVLQSFLWGLDLSASVQGAGGVGGLLALWDASAINGQASTHFTCFDGNGNVMALVNAANGDLSAEYEYGPFGEVLRATGPMATTNPFRFSTKFQDDETGLLYYGYRYYDPGSGRWPNRDPIGEKGGLNLYGFVYNDPLSKVDPLGQNPGALCIPGSIAIGAGGVAAAIAAVPVGAVVTGIVVVAGVTYVTYQLCKCKPWRWKCELAWRSVDEERNVILCAYNCSRWGGLGSQFVIIAVPLAEGGCPPAPIGMYPK